MKPCLAISAMLFLCRAVGSADTAPIPGGMAALAHAGRFRLTSADRFLADYARAIGHRATESWAEPGQTAAAVHEYFSRIRALMADGAPQDGQIVVTIDFGNGASRTKTQRILENLGWAIRGAPDGAHLEPAGRAKLDVDMAAALRIDVERLAESCRTGQAFSFSIAIERVAVLPAAKGWEALYAAEHYAGGLAEAIASRKNLARVYAALADLEPAAAAALLDGVGLPALLERYAARLWMCSFALAVEHGRVVVPGGDEAEPVWTALAGTTPRQPASFFRALFNRDGGKLLPFFAGLSNFDTRRQRVWTRSVSLTEQLYERFKAAPARRGAGGQWFPSDVFLNFLAEVPLDREGSIVYPRGCGPSSPRGDSHSPVLPRPGDLFGLPAVARIDRRRAVPLDGCSAELLARNAGAHGHAYRYFEILTGLQRQHFELFFRLAERLARARLEEKNALLGPIHSLLAILCLAQEAGTLQEDQAADLFGIVIERFLSAGTVSARVRASLDSLRDIVGRAPNREDGVDAALRALVLGAASPIRHASYRAVLDLQAAPSLDAILAAWEEQVGNSERFSQGSIESLERAVRWALHGIVYAFFLRPDDFIVAEDPLLLQKHRFLVPEHRSTLGEVFQRAALIQTSHGSGTHFVGGFAGFAVAVGEVTAAKLTLPVLAGRQIAAIRATRWERLAGDNFRVIDLKAKVASEWLAEATEGDPPKSGFLEALVGIVSPNRRARLTRCLEAGDQRCARGFLTLGEMQLLANRWLERRPADAGESDAASVLRSTLKGMPRAPWAYNPASPVLPYESYEKQLFPTGFAERLAEFELHVARWADARSVAPADVADLAEAAYRVLFRRLSPSDARDWATVLATYEAHAGEALEEALRSR